MSNRLTRGLKKIVFSAGFFTLWATLLIGCAGNQENFAKLSTIEVPIETQTSKINLNSSYARDVNNFFDLNTGYSESFTSYEEAKIKKGWKLKVKYNPKDARTIIDFVRSENNGKRIPVYKNFSKTMTVDHGSVTFLPKGERTFSIPKLYKQMGRKNYSSYFNISNIKIKERKYFANNRIGFITIKPENLDNLYYLAKGKNPIHDKSWEKPDLALTFSHEVAHLAISIKEINLSKDKEEELVISKTNKIRLAIRKPLRSKNGGIVVENARTKSRNDPAWDEKKYNYVVGLMIKNISFPEDSIRWRYAENTIIAANQKLLSKEYKTGKSPRLSLERLQERIEMAVIRKQAHYFTP